jgi:hypothetical protein
VTCSKPSANIPVKSDSSSALAIIATALSPSILPTAGMIKGAELIKMKEYECRLPIFDETLWQAFGDGASQKS